ncbi:D-alanine--D-alanine ligase [Campylobacter corcagiensis]|uniref:D-alanine--D-alanine ligase n=1 Tax=Campylobacter corcagiensis TaxID=1448857 RepID=A0A7M1LGL7_9BACT|nr:D-alanine--D-alanine ligase [Campylobacter corcagiensis]QKF64658.1 D-alanine--D-alanine ligase [Campylobacter corcagiensis]QOQ87174.1 D-alanine--D-alanine ligase [Campylobacter corcagiensis]
MKKGIVFGGQSYEHEISIVSAITLKENTKQEFEYIFCDENRNFFLIEPKNMKATYFSKGEYKKAKSLVLKSGGFYTEGVFGKKLQSEVYINLIHGSDGEDGKIAALFEFYSINFIGPRLEISALSFNKILTKYLAENVGVLTLKWESLTKNSKNLNLPLPVILKPSRLGSSIGIAIVKDSAQLDYALDSTFEYDDLVLVEPYVEGIKEYNLAGCKIGGKIKFSIIEEPKKEKILDFEQKYLSFSGNSKVKEAIVSDEIRLKLQNAFTRIYNAGFDGALIRCDFFEKDGEIYLNEINPNPGSLAYYLFDDFENTLNALANSLPKTRKIPISYNYINSISVNK